MFDFVFKIFVKNHDDTGNPDVRLKYGFVSGITGIVCNIILFLVKIFSGLISNSISIVADAFNNLTDAGSSIITLFGFKMAARPADKEHPFGHGRIEYIAGLAISFFMLILGVELGKSSFEKILAPQPVDFDITTIIILIVSVLVKLWMSVFNKKAGERISSSTLITTAKDSINDVISTAAILMSVMMMYFFKINTDGYIGFTVAVYIVISGIITIKQTTDPLLGEPPDQEHIKGIKDTLMAHKEIIGVHDLIIHNYGPGKSIASIHAEVNSSGDIMETHDIIDIAEKEVTKEYNILLTIHMDPVEIDNERVMALKLLTEQLVYSVSPDMTIHDFRIVGKDMKTCFIFDVINPLNSGMNDDKLIERLKEKIRSVNEKYDAIITVDKDFE